MGRISNKVSYPVKSPVEQTDYLIGTDNITKATNTFPIEDILALFTANNISSLPTVTSRSQDDYLSISQSGLGKKITVEDFMAEPVVNAGNVSGTITVDLSGGCCCWLGNWVTCCFLLHCFWLSSSQLMAQQLISPFQDLFIPDAINTVS